jgi:hypothetical protein
VIAGLIADYSDKRNGPYALDAQPSIGAHKLPHDYFQILAHANGFVTRNADFRFFGLEPCGGLPDIKTWNAGAWVSEYGELVRDIVFVSEDVFGDQYGFSFRDSTPRLTKFWCEGGKLEPLPHASLEEWLLRAVLTSAPSFFDQRLCAEARRSGLQPEASEHLAFALPLITGGEYGVGNLEVLDAQFHLHLLGQLSLKNLSQPEGARISRFWPES